MIEQPERLPTLDELAAAPELELRLPLQALIEVYTRAACLEAGLRAILLTKGLSRPDEARNSLAQDRLWTVPEVADRLGVPKGYVYELTRRGKIPAVRFGKYVRVPDSALKGWIVDRLDSGVHVTHTRPHDGGGGAPDTNTARAHPTPARRTGRGDKEQRGAMGARRVRDSRVRRAPAAASGEDETPGDT